MDRSFLADEHVISASRKFVCVRLATYEDAEENKILANIFSRQGVLENTVFAILSPDGKESLVTAGRSPAWAFGGVSGPGINEQPEIAIQRMAATMEAIALTFPGNGKSTPKDAPLPRIADMRLALNVSAADRQPLVAVYSPDDDQRKTMEQVLARLAWSDQFIGAAQYVVVRDPAEFKQVKDFQAKPGFIVIQPDTFGLKGQVIRQITATTKAVELPQALAQALGQHEPSQLTYNEHRRAGSQAGARWTSKTPNQEQASGRGGRRRPRR
ncbi:MAG: hypothetical protein MK108_15680 [Mariniblastus sp.]|nr:hypothetical protein [Mariniblastus sp.]